MDYEELKRLAATGDLDAQYALAKIYLNGGEGARKNLIQAIEWFGNTANQGYAASQHALADIYCKQSNPNQGGSLGTKVIKNGHAITSKCLQDVGYNYA